MKIASLKKAFITASILFAAGHAGIALAHSGGGVLDPGGNNPSATDLAAVNCSNDGNGEPAYLYGQILNRSAPGGALLSFHIYKGLQMTTSTDTAGDNVYSPGVRLNGGAGVYYISATKTGPGAILFDAIWHCMTSGDVHTGTDINVYQIQ
jgi:hypothetical protein